MTEINDEARRYEEGRLGRDYLCMSPESVALRALVDAIGAFVVVESESAIDVVETIEFNDD